MRVYLSTTLSGLAAAYAGGRFVIEGADDAIAGHAVTAAIREWYVEGDLEELEYAAMTEAAEASLWLLAADPAAPRRRVVVAADVSGAVVSVAPGAAYRSAVRVAAAVPLSAVASVHVDEVDAEPAVVSAAAALVPAAAGDDDAQFMLDEAESHELLWYDVTEIPDLL